MDFKFEIPEVVQKEFAERGEKRAKELGNGSNLFFLHGYSG